MGTVTVIDLHDYELGTLFQYGAKEDWCRDGQAEIIEAFDRRYLVDTYWRDRESALSPDEVSSAVVTFVPSEHRKITPHAAEVYGEERVVRISRQNGSYETFYVRADVPELTEADHYRHMLRSEEERHAEAVRQVESTRRSVERYRAHLAKLEAAQ